MGLSLIINQIHRTLSAWWINTFPVVYIHASKFWCQVGNWFKASKGYNWDSWPVAYTSKLAIWCFMSFIIYGVLLLCRIRLVYWKHSAHLQGPGWRWEGFFTGGMKITRYFLHASSFWSGFFLLYIVVQMFVAILILFTSFYPLVSACNIIC